jgi:hypothetical protein
MARARNIKPGFFRNADMVELPVEVRLLFIGLWTLADREGRIEDRPKQIKMELFPADSFDVGSMLSQLHAAGFVDRYEVDSIKVLEVVNFIKHQDPHYKEKASELPPRPGTENFMRASGVTRLQRQRILERDGNACIHCAAKDALCIDHIIPVSRGGDSSDDNLQVLCSACNTKKGNKLDGESKNSRQRRANIDPTLNQRNAASPSESGFLNPESLLLNPDSLIPEVRTPPRKRDATQKVQAIAKPDDVDQQTWTDFHTLRNKKRAPVTQTVIDDARRECLKAGMTLESFLRVWCRRGSQGLEASWLKPDETGKHPNASTLLQKKPSAHSGLTEKNYSAGVNVDGTFA